MRNSHIDNARFVLITLVVLGHLLKPVKGGAYIIGQPIMAALFIVVPTVIVFGTKKYKIIKDFGKFGDFSYGIYIYAFMVQQTFVWYFGNTLSLAANFVLVTTVTLVCAFLSWHLIEKPALALKKHFHHPLSFRNKPSDKDVC